MPPDDNHDGGTSGQDAEKSNNVGDALRRVYREAVDETVPQDLLDLLNKLN